ncbi:MAG: hypothetical protein Tsb002_36970 [Wenzhouxiangellaceae bacterium]
MSQISKQINQHWAETEETAAMRIEQAKVLRRKAAQGSGLSFEGFLTPDLAEWILAMVETGEFIDPGEAVYVLMQQAKELNPHEDLRKELLNRMLQEAADSPHPPISGEEAFERLKKIIKEPMPETVRWKKIDNSRHEPKSSSITWNYRVIRYDDGSHRLHEVFYDEKGQPNSYTENAIDFVADAEEGLDGVIQSLEKALKDAGKYPILDMKIFTEKQKLR